MKEDAPRSRRLGNEGRRLIVVDEISRKRASEDVEETRAVGGVRVSHLGDDAVRAARVGVEGKRLTL